MPEENGQQGDGGAGNQGGSNGKTPIESLPIDVQAYIKELREEAKNNRESKTTLQQQLDAAKTAQQAQLAEQGQFKTLAEQHAVEVARLKAFEGRTTELEQIIRASNDERIKSIPDNKKALVQPLIDILAPDTLQVYLNANPSLFVKEPAPDYNAGAGANGGGGNGAPKLTVDEQEAAKRMGITAEEYAKAKAKLSKSN